MTELSEWLIPAQQAALASYGYSHLPLALCSTTVKMFCHFQPNKNKPLVDRKQVGQHTGRSAPGNVCATVKALHVTIRRDTANTKEPECIELQQYDQRSMDPGEAQTRGALLLRNSSNQWWQSIPARFRVPLCSSLHRLLLSVSTSPFRSSATPAAHYSVTFTAILTCLHC